MHIYACRRWLGRDARQAMEIRRRWAARLLRVLGVRVQVIGSVPDRPCLIVANHRSYLDPIVLLRDVHAYPVAKAELARWPIIGKGARWAGIIYLQRERKEAGVSALKRIAKIIMEEGFSVIVFPEGTTSDRSELLPLKKGALRAATRWSLPVVPAAICFEDSRDFWVGEEPFFRHAWRRFQKREIFIRIHYGAPLCETDESLLEQRVIAWIEAHLKNR